MVLPRQQNSGLNGGEQSEGRTVVKHQSQDALPVAHHRGTKVLPTSNTSARGKKKQPTQGATNTNSKNGSSDPTSSQNQQ